MQPTYRYLWFLSSLKLPSVIPSLVVPCSCTVIIWASNSAIVKLHAHEFDKSEPGWQFHVNFQGIFSHHRENRGNESSPLPFLELLILSAVTPVKKIVVGDRASLGWCTNFIHNQRLIIRVWGELKMLLFRRISTAPGVYSLNRQ